MDLHVNCRSVWIHRSWIPKVQCAYNPHCRMDSRSRWNLSNRWTKTRWFDKRVSSVFAFTSIVFTDTITFALSSIVLPLSPNCRYFLANTEIVVDVSYLHWFLSQFVYSSLSRNRIVCRSGDVRDDDIVVVIFNNQVIFKQWSKVRSEEEWGWQIYEINDKASWDQNVKSVKD
jgi:hypothetical protein